VASASTDPGAGGGDDADDEMDSCLGVTGSSGYTASVDSVEFDHADGSNVTSTVDMVRTRDELTRDANAIAGPHFLSCLEQAFRTAVQRTPDVTIDDLHVTDLPVAPAAPVVRGARVVAEVTTNGQEVTVIEDGVILGGGRIEATVLFEGVAHPVDAALEARVTAAIGARLTAAAPQT
jgi:hypothetical protein